MNGRTCSIDKINDSFHLMKADVKDFEQSLKRLNSTEQDKNFRRRTW